MKNSLHSLHSLGLLAVLALSFSSAHADEQDRTMVITNETSTAVIHFYASSVAAQTWEEDLLAGRVLESAKAAGVDLDDGSGACLFDFKFDFADGTSTQAQAVNVCKVGRYFIRE